MSLPKRWKQMGIKGRGAKYLLDFLSEHGDSTQSVYEQITAIAMSGEGAVRERAICYLGELKYRRATGLIIDVLQEAMRSDWPRRRNMISNCCGALGMIDSDRSHRTLVAIVSELSAPWDRAGAVRALGYEVLHSNSELILSFLQADVDPVVQEFAREAVWEQSVRGIIKPYERVILGWLASPDPCLRVHAADTLANADDPAYLASLEKLADDQELCAQLECTVAASAEAALRSIRDSLRK